MCHLFDALASFMSLKCDKEIFEFIKHSVVFLLVWGSNDFIVGFSRSRSILYFEMRVQLTGVLLRGHRTIMIPHSDVRL